MGRTLSHAPVPRQPDFGIVQLRGRTGQNSGGKLLPCLGRRGTHGPGTGAVPQDRGHSGELLSELRGKHGDDHGRISDARRQDLAELQGLFTTSSV